MGAWETGPFENDAAMDVIGELVQVKSDPKEVANKLSGVMSFVLEPGEAIDNPDMGAAIAAACIVAVRIDPSIPYGNRLAEEDLKGLVFDVEENDLKDLAKRVFERAYNPEDNEWYELWEEADGLEEAKELNEPFRKTVNQ